MAQGLGKRRSRARESSIISISSESELEEEDIADPSPKIPKILTDCRFTRVAGKQVVLQLSSSFAAVLNQ